MTKKTIFIIESSQTNPNIIINFFDKERQESMAEWEMIKACMDGTRKSWK